MPEPVTYSIISTCHSMSEEAEGALAKLLANYSQYYLSGRFFYHWQLALRLREIGFKVLSIEKLSTHPVWRIRLKQVHCRYTFLWVYRLLEPKLKAEIQRILKDLRRGVKAQEIAIVNNGMYFAIAFVWPVGRGGFWQPEPKPPHAIPPVLHRWLKQQGN